MDELDVREGMKTKIRTISVLIVLIMVSCLAWAWWVMRPRVYRKATSPDATWSVTVVRKRTALPPIEGVDVIVQVEDARGQIVFEQTIDNRDLWSDVDDRYPEVVCQNDEIRIGPRWWDGKQSTYFRLRKKDLEQVRGARQK